MSVGSNIKHDSSYGHVTGTSIFVDDRSPLRGEIHVGVVGSPYAAGNLKEVHFEEALKLPGVLAIYTAKDLSHNRWGAIFKTQPLLVDKEIGHFRRYKINFFKKLKFKNVKIEKLIYLDCLGYFLYFLNKQFYKNEIYPSESKIFIWDKFFTPFTLFIDKIFNYKFGKNVLCIIKKI